MSLECRSLKTPSHDAGGRGGKKLQNYVNIKLIYSSGVPRNFIRGDQLIQLRTEDRENWDLGAVAP